MPPSSPSWFHGTFRRRLTVKMNLFLPVVSVKANKFHFDSLSSSFNGGTIFLIHLSLASKHFSSLQHFLFGKQKYYLSSTLGQSLGVSFLICHQHSAVWECSVFYSAAASPTPTPTPNNLFCSARRTHWQMFPALGIYLVGYNGCKEFENARRANCAHSSKTIRRGKTQRSK